MIAKKYNVEVGLLKSLNKLSSDTIKVGRILTIPQKEVVLVEAVGVEQVHLQVVVVVMEVVVLVVQQEQVESGGSGLVMIRYTIA